MWREGAEEEDRDKEARARGRERKRLGACEGGRVGRSDVVTDGGDINFG